LIIGNLLAYCITKEVRVQLKLKGKRQIAKDIYEFDFVPRGSFYFLPGQYLEWTITPVDADSRGNRRYFTIASSPTEKVLSIAVKVDQNSSSFKKHLLEMREGSSIVAGQLAGDFVLPKDQQQKLVLIAGGIGITPFRSMARYLIDRREQRDVVLFYICSHPDEFAYDVLWQEAKNHGWKVVLVLSNRAAKPSKWTGELGYLTTGMLKRQVPDYAERQFYLSGPNAMVTSYKKLLSKLGVAASQLKTDYFPGF
jgi:ferredoxin-NADP reductase